MADLTQLTRATSCANGEWRRDGLYGRWYAWAKDPSAGERNAMLWKHGGAETNWEDVDFATSAPPNLLMFVNELNGVLILYDTSPGWFQLEAGEDTESRDVFDKALEDAEAIAWLRSQLGGRANAYLPSGMFITQRRDRTVMGGVSSGAYDTLRCQLAPEGSLPVSRDRIIDGGASWAATQDHYCDVLYCAITQVPFDQFCEYVVDTTGDTTYLSDSSGGANVAGATTLKLDGDVVNTLYRANIVAAEFASGYVSSGSSNLSDNTVLVVGTGTAPMKRGDSIAFTIASVDYVHKIKADFGGGSGSVHLFNHPLEVDVPPGTAIRYRQELVIKTDHLGAGTVAVFPAIAMTIPDNTPLKLQHPAPEAYGRRSWPGQYCIPAVSGFVWRSDDPSGDGYPMADKAQMGVETLCFVENQRVHDVSLMLVGAADNSLVTSELTGARSFLTHWTPGVANPVLTSLHAEWVAFWLAWWFRDATSGGPVNLNTALYQGNTLSNVNAGDISVLWNLGTNADITPAVFKAYLQARGF